MTKYRCYICGEKITDKQKVCDSCSSFLDSYYSTYLLESFPFDQFPEIERENLIELFKNPKVVSLLKQILTMDVKELQDNFSSINIKINEIIGQLEDNEMRNTLNHFFRLLCDGIVEMSSIKKDRKNEDKYKIDFLRAQDLINKSKIFIKLKGKEFTQEGIENILSLDKPFDIINRNIGNIKNPALRMLIFHVSILDNYIPYFEETIDSLLYSSRFDEATGSKLLTKAVEILNELKLSLKEIKPFSEKIRAMAKNKEQNQLYDIFKRMEKNP